MKYLGTFDKNKQYDELMAVIAANPKAKSFGNPYSPAVSVYVMEVSN